MSFNNLLSKMRERESERGGESLRQEQKEKESCKEKKYRQRETEVLLQSFVFSRLSCDLTNTISPQLDQQYPRLNCNDLPSVK